MSPTLLLSLGLALIVFSAAFGISKISTAASDGIARQPEAADKIKDAMFLPLVFIEGVAIVCGVFSLLMLILK